MIGLGFCFWQYPIISSGDNAGGPPSIVMADFLSHMYTLNGSPAVVSDLFVGNADWLPYDTDPGESDDTGINSHGLNTDPVLVDGIVDPDQGSFVVLLEMNALADSAQIALSDMDLPDYVSNFYIAYIAGQVTNIYIESSQESANMVPIGAPFKAATRWRPAEFSSVITGGVVETFSVTPLAVRTDFGIDAPSSSDNGSITKITIYADMDDAALAALVA